MTAHSGGKRERILEAAEKIFAQRGFYNARVAEIARDAGVADGTIYLYFKSKDDLLISIFETRMEVVNNTLEKAIACEESAPEKLRLFVRAYLELVAENRPVAEVLTVELRQSSKFMKEYSNPRFADLLRMISTVVEQGQREGTFSEEIPASIAARILFGCLDELALAWCLGAHEKFDIVRAADWVGVMALRGLETRRHA